MTDPPIVKSHGEPQEFKCAPGEDGDERDFDDFLFAV